MKVGDLVRPVLDEVRRDLGEARGIVLQFYPGTAKYTKVYWLSHKQYSSHPANDLEVVSESR